MTGCMNGLMNESMDARINSWIEGLTDGPIDACAQ